MDRRFAGTECEIQSVLLVEDDEDDYFLVQKLFSEPPLQRFRLEWVSSYDAALQVVESNLYDVFILDYRLGSRNGLDLIEDLRRKNCRAPVIVLTGYEDYEVDLEAMRAGAADYLVKGRISADLLERSIRYSTERKATEEALRQSEARYRAIIEDQTELISLFRPDGTLTFVNEAFSQYFGKSREDLVGHVFISLVSSEDREKVLRLHASMSPENPSIVCEHRVINDRGEVRWNRRHDRALFDQMGRPVAFQSMARDITERKQAEHGLQQQLARIQLLNQITRSIADRQDLSSIFSVVIHHLEDHLPIDYGSIYILNPELGLLSLKSQATKSSVLATMADFHEFTLNGADCNIRSVIDRGELVYVPELSRSDEALGGRLAEAGLRSMVALPLLVESKVLGILIVARYNPDAFSSEEHAFLRALSEHVALAAHHASLYEDLWDAYNELRETQQSAMQQERMRALGQMASGIAHDINNALSPIVGFTDVLIEHEKTLSERARGYLEMIKIASADISHIVAQMREFYREREDQHELLPVNLNRLVKQVLDLTRPKWKDIPQEHGTVISIRTQLQLDLPPAAGIESEIREALTNLVLNAVDAMPQGGVMVIRTHREGNCEAIEVEDSGMGMSETTRLRCLEPLYTTKGERGTGMGLAMVYGIMQRHEGEIRIESQLGKGTTMSLLFPLREPREADATEAEQRGPLSCLRILCIDDEPLVRLVVKEMLESDGHMAEVADGGQNGLNMFFAAIEQGNPFDLVITDLGMPYLDGREVVRRIKREAPTTPVILLTGWGGRMKAEGNIPPQVDRIVTKPPTVSKIREALRKALI